MPSVVVYHIVAVEEQKAETSSKNYMVDVTEVDEDYPMEMASDILWGYHIDLMEVPRLVEYLGSVTDDAVAGDAAVVVAAVDFHHVGFPHAGGLRDCIK